MGELLGSSYERVHAICRRMLCAGPDAEDAAQQVMVQAIRSLQSFDGRSSFSTWIYRVATNVCLDELRRRRRRPLLGIAWPAGEREGATVKGGRAGGDEQGVAAASGVVAASGVAGSGWEDPAEQAASRVDLDAALSQVPAGFRAAVVLRDVSGLSYEEIATALGIPVGTVRSRIARGRAVLADLLGPGAASNEPRGGSHGQPAGSEGGNSTGRANVEALVDRGQGQSGRAAGAQAPVEP